MAIVFSDVASQNFAPGAGTSSSMAYSPPIGNAVTFGIGHLKDSSAPFRLFNGACYAGTVLTAGVDISACGFQMRAGYVQNPVAGPCNVVMSVDVNDFTTATIVAMSYTGIKSVQGFVSAQGLNASAKTTVTGTVGDLAIGGTTPNADASPAAGLTQRYGSSAGFDFGGDRALAGSTIIQFDLASSQKWVAAGWTATPVSSGPQMIWFFLQRELMRWVGKARTPEEWLHEWLEGMERWNRSPENCGWFEWWLRRRRGSYNAVAR